jgi:hypothetical protein
MPHHGQVQRYSWSSDISTFPMLRDALQPRSNSCRPAASRTAYAEENSIAVFAYPLHLHSYANGRLQIWTGMRRHAPECRDFGRVRRGWRGICGLAERERRTNKCRWHRNRYLQQGLLRRSRALATKPRVRSRCPRVSSPLCGWPF